MTATEPQAVQGIAAHTPAAGPMIEPHRLGYAVRMAEELGLVPRGSWHDYSEMHVNRIKAVVQAAMGA